MPVAGRKTPPAQVAAVITVCARGVCAPVDGRKNTTSASLKDPAASVQVGVGCTNNMQLQPPSTRSGPAWGAVGVSNAAIKATCVMVHLNFYMPLRKLP